MLGPQRLKMGLLQALGATAGLAVLLSVHGIAFGQAGSSGGSVGRVDKSISGGVEPQVHGRAQSRSHRKKSSENDVATSIAGAWSWTADCEGYGHYHGVFDLSPMASGAFTGEFTGTNISDLGAITNGRIDGANISFLRHAPPGDIIQHWVGRISGGHIVGSLSGNADCRWQARK